MKTVYQAQTFRLKLLLKNGDGSVTDLSGASAVGRFDLPGGTVEFPAVIDTIEGSVTLTIDRTVTAKWRIGKYDLQIWLDYGEGAEIEADVIYTSIVTVGRGL